MDGRSKSRGQKVFVPKFVKDFFLVNWLIAELGNEGEGEGVRCIMKYVDDELSTRIAIFGEMVTYGFSRKRLALETDMMGFYAITDVLDVFIRNVETMPPLL